MKFLKVIVDKLFSTVYKQNICLYLKGEKNWPRGQDKAWKQHAESLDWNPKSNREW